MLFWLSDLGTSDDSSLSDSVVQDEGENQRPKQILLQFVAINSTTNLLESIWGQ